MSNRASFDPSSDDMRAGVEGSPEPPEGSRMPAISRPTGDRREGPENGDEAAGPEAMPESAPSTSGRPAAGNESAELIRSAGSGATSCG